MLRLIYASILLLILITDVSSQFYDFFSAFQPLVQTTRSYHYDVTTKRTKQNNRQNTPKIIDNLSKLTYDIDNINTNRERQRQNPQISYDSTTLKSVRKTTKNISSQNNDTRTRNKTPKDRNIAKPNRDRLEHSRTQNQGKTSNDGVIFDDGKRNTVISYETTRKYQEYDKKVHQTTQYPFTVRPGVKPVISNGPPITNKPATQRPNFGPKPVEDDISVSPELIIGPDEDYMTSVEKRRYVEMAEKMCDKYKALNNKQIQFIPLLPSPDVVKLNVSTCTPSTVPLVVGGKVVTIDEFPHMALLGWTKLRYGGYSWKCGGSLISNRYVLTAAHCVYQERDNTVVTGPPRAVQLGSSYMGGQNAVVVKVAAVIRHPKYKLPKSYYDIAIIKMASTVTFSKVIKPACLGTPPPPGQPIIATGWGRTEFGGDQSEELRSVSIPIWDMDECYSILGTSRKIPDGPSSESQICAGEKRGGKDTCLGDSGGPAQIQDGCIWRVVAVTSLGRSCGAPHTPAIYAKVQKAFISAVIFGDQIKNKPPQTNQQDNSPWNNNQQTYTERNNNQQNIYNTDSNSRQLINNRRRFDDQSDNANNYQTNNNRNTQNSNGQSNNNNDYTTARPAYNNPRTYNNDQTTPRSAYNNPQSYNNDYTTARPAYNNPRTYNNDQTTPRSAYNNPRTYNNDQTTPRPANNNPQSYNNDYTTARPAYNNAQSYNNDYDSVPDYQADRNPYYTVILLNILKSINSYTLNSVKNKQDLIDIIKTLNNDYDGRTDEIKNFNKKQGYEEIRELPDEEKEKTLQQMLWLLKKNISAQKQYEELMKAPINSGSRMYFIKNPEVLEEYKNYVRRKKNLPSHYDVSDNRKEDVKEILKKLQRRAELTASSDQTENFDRQDSQDIDKDESIETTFKPNSLEDKPNTELLDETSEKVNTEANPEQSNKKIDSFESHNKRAQDATDDIVRREKIDWTETKDELNPKRNDEKSKSRKDKHKIRIDKKERLFDDLNQDSYIPFKQKPRISYRKPKSDGKKDFFSYGRTSIPFIGKKGIYEDK